MSSTEPIQTTQVNIVDHEGRGADFPGERGKEEDDDEEDEGIDEALPPVQNPVEAGGYVISPQSLAEGLGACYSREAATPRTRQPGRLVWRAGVSQVGNSNAHPSSRGSGPHIH